MLKNERKLIMPPNVPKDYRERYIFDTKLDMFRDLLKYVNDKVITQLRYIESTITDREVNSEIFKDPNIYVNMNGKYVYHGEELSYGELKNRIKSEYVVITMYAVVEESV